MIDAKVYLTDSSNNVICFKHAVKAVIEDDEDISVEVDLEEGNSDSWNSCFGVYVRECAKCEEDREEASGNA